MFKKKTIFKFKKGDTAISCEGYTSEEVISFINLVTGAEVANEPDINLIKKIAEKNGDLNEFVDSGDKKDIEFIKVEKDLQRGKLPNCTPNFTCPNCNQSILLENDNKILVRDYRNHKLYDIGELKLPSMTNVLDDVNDTMVLAVYKDCIEMIDRTKEFVLVSGSTEKCSCPVCGHDGTVGEFVKYHETHYNDGETCDICGCEKDNVISQLGDGSTKANSDCVNHCIEKLNKLNEE